MRCGLLCILTGVTGDVWFEGARLSVYVPLALGWSLAILAGVVVYAGRASTYKLYYFACINTVALLKAFVAWKIRWVVVDE